MPLLSKCAVEPGGNSSKNGAFSRLSPAKRSSSDPRKKFAFSIFPLGTTRMSKSALAVSLMIVGSLTVRI